MINLSKMVEHRQFDKCLLAFLFVSTVALTIHLMHKSDAGGNDTAFIVWSEAQAATILGRLIGMFQDSSKDNNSPNEISKGTQ